MKEKNKLVEHVHKNFLQTVRDFVKVCPRCQSINIYTRTRKKPKYKCLHCNNEFDNPDAQIVHKTIKEHKDYVLQYSEPDDYVI